MSKKLISENSEQNLNNGAAGACPYLKLKGDSSTRFGFANAYNYCYKSTKPHPVRFAYQTSTCLQGNHIQCPVFQQEWKGPLPDNIQGISISKKRILKRAALAISILLCLGAITGILLLSFGDTFPKSDKKSPPYSDEIIIAQEDLQSPSTETDEIKEKHFIPEDSYSLFLPIQAYSLKSSLNKGGNIATVTNEIAGISGFSVVDYYRLSSAAYYDFYPFGLGRNFLVLTDDHNIPSGETSLFIANR